MTKVLKNEMNNNDQHNFALFSEGEKECLCIQSWSREAPRKILWWRYVRRCKCTILLLFSQTCWATNVSLCKLFIVVYLSKNARRTCAKNSCTCSGMSPSLYQYNIQVFRIQTDVDFFYYPRSALDFLIWKIFLQSWHICPGSTVPI